MANPLKNAVAENWRSNPPTPCRWRLIFTLHFTIVSPTMKVSKTCTLQFPLLSEIPQSHPRPPTVPFLLLRFCLKHHLPSQKMMDSRSHFLPPIVVSTWLISSFSIENWRSDTTSAYPISKKLFGKLTFFIWRSSVSERRILTSLPILILFSRRNHLWIQILLSMTFVTSPSLTSIPPAQPVFSVATKYHLSSKRIGFHSPNQSRSDQKYTSMLRTFPI